MAGEVNFNAFYQKYAGQLDNAVKAHAEDETTYGNEKLPAGIENGVCQLTKCKLKEVEGDDKANPGELMVQFEGMICEPTSIMVQGRSFPLRGKRVYKVQMIGETKDKQGKVVRSVDDNISKLFLEMRRLAGPNFTSGKTARDIPALVSLLDKAKPYFRFSTTKTPEKRDDKTGKVIYEERVWENWDGNVGLEDYSPPEASGTTDETSRSNTANARGVGGGSNEPADNTVSNGNSSAVSVEYSDNNDIDSLVARANELDEINEPTRDALIAQKRLGELAKANGATDEQISIANTWRDVANLAVGNSESGENLGIPSFKVGETYFYKLKEKKGKVEIEKTISVEITKVNGTACDVKRLDGTKAVIKDVPYSLLLDSENSK